MRPHFPGTTLSLLAALFLAGAEAHGEGTAPERIAVHHFAANGVDIKLVQTLEVSFCTQLSSSSLDVLCPDDLDAIASQRDFETRTGQLDEASPARRMTRIVAGDVSKLGKEFVITVKMIELASNDVVARATASTDHADGLLLKMPKLAKDLRAQLK